MCFKLLICCIGALLRSSFHCSSSSSGSTLSVDSQPTGIEMCFHIKAKLTHFEISGANSFSFTCSHRAQLGCKEFGTSSFPRGGPPTDKRQLNHKSRLSFRFKTIHKKTPAVSFIQEAHIIMCNHMKRACYSQEGVVEFGCDCVRLSVPTHPDSGVRLEQTGAVLSAPPGTGNSTLSCLIQHSVAEGKTIPKSLHLPFVTIC